MYGCLNTYSREECLNNYSYISPIPIKILQKSDVKSHKPKQERERVNIACVVRTQSYLCVASKMGKHMMSDTV